MKEDDDKKEQNFPSSEKIEDLLRSRYAEEFSRKDTLDEKANNMMAVASTVATIYGGLGIAAATNLFKQFGFDLSAAVLLIGVSLLIGSIIISTKSYLLREYQYILSHDFFVEYSNNDFNYKDQKIDEFRNKNPIELSRLLIRNYGKCITKNYVVNEKKAKELGRSQKIFLIGVATVPLFAIVSVL